jgi:hypothetical protein
MEHSDLTPPPNPDSDKKSPTLKDQVAGLDAEQRYEKFKGMLKGRGMTVKEIARLATKSDKNWPHVSQVLRGMRKGHKTWLRLADFLTREELIVLDKDSLIKVEVKPESST